MIKLIKKKIKDFKNFKINKSLMKLCQIKAIFLHCLPRGSEVEEKCF